MENSAKRQRRLWDAYAFLDFRPLHTVRGIFDDAVGIGIARSEKTPKNVEGAWIQDQKVLVDSKGKISKYRVTLKVLDPNAAKHVAERSFNAATAEARVHGNRWMELCAANSLAGLWQSQSKRHEARKLLAPIYGRFTEDFDTQDLKDAKALLDELQA